MFLLYFLQFDWNKLRPENLFGAQVIERTPAGLSLIYMAGILLLIVLLLLSFIRNLRPTFAFQKDLPKEVKRRLSITATNRSLRIWQVIFVFLALFVYGFHVYWAAFAEKDNERFQELSGRDLRYRRSTSSQLRGWMLDRSGKLSNALAYYKKDANGDIVRTFALDKEMAYFLGTELGSPGLERTLYKQTADPMPEAWEVLTKIKKTEPEQTDVRITIDRDLQAYLAKLLEVELKKDRKGAIVVLNPQTGDVLGMYSTPSFSLSEVKTIDDMHQLEKDKKNNPLLSRATREYYIPGSTFKTFTMISAFRAGKNNLMFESFPAGYFPVKGIRPIIDSTQHYDKGSKTVSGVCDGGCDSKEIKRAYTVSSNQYFAQMAVALERERLAETAKLVGIAAVDETKDAGSQGYFPDIWNVSNSRISSALAPAHSAIVTGKKSINLFDLATEGYGQGYAGQMTPFQMALIASIPANMQGNLMKPRIEADLPPQPFNQIVTPQQSAEMREIMATVTEEGTAASTFGRLMDKDVRVGGKTGTAEKAGVKIYNADGTLKTHKAKHKVNGVMVEYQEPDTYKRTDSWFICIAPLGLETAPEVPQLAIAVVVEGGGFGATTAAPIAIAVIKKARELGLLGDKYKPKTQPQNAPKKKKGQK